jgi:hypothetical protein
MAAETMGICSNFSIARDYAETCTVLPVDRIFATSLMPQVSAGESNSAQQEDNDRLGI